MDESIFQELQLRFNIEYWLEPLAPITFETQFVPIGAEEARLFIACYTHLQVNKLPREELPQELQRPLSALQARLEACVASVRGHESEAERVFVKGSPRSAKETTIVNRVRHWHWHLPLRLSLPLATRCQHWCQQ